MSLNHESQKLVEVICNPHTPHDSVHPWSSFFILPKLDPMNTLSHKKLITNPLKNILF